MSFYVDLPSNTRTGEEFVRENTTSKFRVRLPEEIRLGSEPWEVALVELQYPHSWNNITTEEYFASYNYLKQNRIHFDSKIAGYQSAAIPVGYYGDIEQLTAAIYEAMDKEITVDDDTYNLADHCHFRFEKVKNRVRFKLTSDDLSIVYISPQVEYMLGFKIRALRREFGEDIVWAHYPPDITAGINSLFVHCDIIAPQIVGNTHAPLLRIVPVSGKHGDIIDRIFTSPHYVPVLKKQFSTIEISINTDQDKPFAFQFGKSIVKLHFRRYRAIRT